MDFRLFQSPDFPRNTCQSRSFSPSFIVPVHLNLGHVGPTTTGAAATKVHRGRAGQEDRDDNGGHITSPAKPEESCRGLGFAAALRGVGGAVGDLVVENI